MEKKDVSGSWPGICIKILVWIRNDYRSETLLLSLFLSCLHPEEHPLVAGLELEHEHAAGGAGRHRLHTRILFKSALHHSDRNGIFNNLNPTKKFIKFLTILNLPLCRYRNKYTKVKEKNTFLFVNLVIIVLFFYAYQHLQIDFFFFPTMLGIRIPKKFIRIRNNGSKTRGITIKHLLKKLQDENNKLTLSYTLLIYKTSSHISCKYAHLCTFTSPPLLL